MSQLGTDVAIRSLGDSAHGGVRLRTAIVLLIAAIAAAACSEGPTATSVAGGAASVEPAASAEESEAATAEAASAEASPAAEGPKLFKVGEQIEVSIDGVRVQRGWVTLPSGPHEVTWRGPGGTIRLVAATCPERRALGEGGA